MMLQQKSYVKGAVTYRPLHHRSGTLMADPRTPSTDIYYKAI